MKLYIGLRNLLGRFFTRNKGSAVSYILGGVMWFIAMLLMILTNKNIGEIKIPLIIVCVFCAADMVLRGVQIKKMSADNPAYGEEFPEIDNDERGRQVNGSAAYMALALFYFLQLTASIFTFLFGMVDVTITLLILTMAQLLIFDICRFCEEMAE